MQDRFTRQALQALKLAKATAQSWKHSYIGTEHILAGLLKEKEGTAGRILEEFGVEEEALEQLINKLIAPSSEILVAERTPVYSPRARKLVELAVHEAENQQENEAGTEHLLLAMLKETDCVATRLLYTMGVNIQKLYTALLNAMGIENPALAEELQNTKAKGQKGSATPTLDQYSRDLTVMASEGRLDPVVGRDKDTQSQKQEQSVSGWRTGSR